MKQLRRLHALTFAGAMSACVLMPASALAEVPMLGFPDVTPNVNELNSGRFVNLSRGLASLGATQEAIGFRISVPASLREFKVSVFDGDLSGTWDRGSTGSNQAVYTLYRDPGETSTVDAADEVGVWLGSAMPNDAWCDLGFGANDTTTCNDVTAGGTADPFPGASPAVIPLDVSACPDFPEGTCHYHLTATWEVPSTSGDVSNLFKVAVQGQLALNPGSTLGLLAWDFNPWGFNPVYDPSASLEDSLALLDTFRTAYDGSFPLDFYVPVDQLDITIFDADFDNRDDTDDPNTPSMFCEDTVRGETSYVTGNQRIYAYYNILSHSDAVSNGCTIPVYDAALDAWVGVHFLADALEPDERGGLLPAIGTSSATYAEGQLPGDPLDDSTNPYTIKFSPSVRYQIISPDHTTGGAWFSKNDDPSGNSEWEMYRIGLAGAGVPDPDVEQDELPSGIYTLDIYGLDASNNVFLATNYNLMPGTTVDCHIDMEKSCRVLTSEVPDMLCETAITSTTLRYTGPSIANATVTFTGTKAVKGGTKQYPTATYENVELVSGVTILADPSQDGWTITSPMLGSKMTIVVTNNDPDNDGDPSNDTDVDYTEIIHTSCSAVYVGGQPAPLDASSPNPIGTVEKGDDSPAWFVERFQGKDGAIVDAADLVGSHLCEIDLPEASAQEGVAVEYTYVISNPSPTDSIQGIAILDDHLGVIAEGEFLAPAEQRTFTETFVVTESVFNVATVVGQQVGQDSVIRSCLANEAATVIVNGGLPAPDPIPDSIPDPIPGGCMVSTDSILPHVHGDQIDLNFYNDGSTDVHIGSVDITWPGANGKLKKITNGKDAWFDKDRAPTSTVISSDDWKKAEEDRIIKHGDDLKLRFQFQNDVEATGYSITVHYVEGCSVTFSN